MQDHAARLIGLQGFVVTEVQRVGERLDLQVELLARAAACVHCGGVDVRVKERPRVRVRDLPIAGRPTRLVWRKRRYRCADCGRTFTEADEQLPARQRVTGHFRARLAERVADGAAQAEVAREEHTSRYQVTRAFADRAEQREARDGDHRPRRRSLDEAHHRRGGELATVVSDLDRRRVIELLDGHDRRTVQRWLSARRALVEAPAQVAARPARLRRIRQGHPHLALRAAGLLRRADHQRLRRGRHQQGQSHQAPRLRHPHLHRLPPTRAPSMRLNGTTRRHPAQSTRTAFQPARGE